MRSIEWWHCPWPWVPPNHPKPCTSFSAFCTAIHSFVTGEPRDFKFCSLTYHNKSHSADEKSSLKGAWPGSSNPFLEFYTPCNIFVTTNAIETSDFVHGWAMWSLSLVMSECSLSGCGQGHVNNFCIVDLENFATASRRYTGDIRNSSMVGLFMTSLRQWKRLGRVMVKCTCLLHIASN